MFQEIAQWFEEAKTRWWIYVLGYFAVTSLIGFVLKMAFRHTNRVILYAMFFPAMLMWKVIRLITGRTKMPNR